MVRFELLPPESRTFQIATPPSILIELIRFVYTIYTSTRPLIVRENNFEFRIRIEVMVVQKFQRGVAPPPLGRSAPLWSRQ